MYSSWHHLLYLIGHLAAASKLCYAPDGSVSPGDGYLPCINTLNVDSMCCVLNVTALKEINEPATDADTCSTSGLCEMANGEFARNYCTDQTWKSPNCLNLCTGGTSGGTNSSYTILTHCADGSWCCGEGNLTSCCNLSRGFQIAASIPPYAASATAAFTATATTTVTNTSTLTSAPSNTNNSLGIGLGVALGVVLLAVAVVAIVLFRRHRVRLQLHGTKLPEAVGRGYYSPESELGQSNMSHEVPSWKEPVEMYGGPERH